ncbi:radical SAM family protein [Novosphingobium nitrogenifigens DSM 19370]|uniref:Radical SAM family protein n=1 Tax=Novosphingobium nitrogenifigens DSM 19370 TaxID=983920 RepID=F1Z7Z1_9SPHN|nr:quinohemoprotein amine dehydrogenase maturation protein [Novosphingobium nitrogenifigens]EGD59234.1 radical SAM family protein [Novosphingobium nitrogenifigens DSM 19370]
MSAPLLHRYRAGEMHRFAAADAEFVYLPTAGAIFALDGATADVLERLQGGAVAHDELAAALVADGMDPADADGLLRELRLVRLIESDQVVSAAPAVDTPPADFPLQALVLNITNQCNLACTYCYEFGADRIATPTGKPKYMTPETARAAVDFLLDGAKGRESVHITFFGGETLMNFRLLRDVVAYADERAAENGRKVTYSLTTNATLLTDEIIDFLADKAIGVTVSIDGPEKLQDARRVYKSGKGSYAVILPRLKALIARHRRRAITARVTLSAGVTDVVGIYRHLKDEIGFHEIGFAPVTSAGEDRDWGLDGDGMGTVLAGFHALAQEWLDHALRGQMHGFSNVSETIGELVAGTNKSHPCGAGIGLLGVSPSGDLSPCHRFTDADDHVLGHVDHGVDHEKRVDFLARGHVGAKYECTSCWARPLCAGGCHHEAFVRYGDTGHANLHYCDWIREWTDRCLGIYGTLAARNPAFLDRFADRKVQS